MAKIDVLVAGALRANALETLSRLFNSHRVAEADDLDAVLSQCGDAVRGIARGGHFDAPRELLKRLPKLEIVANFGVGYDGIDLDYCAAKGIVVTNTPDVLTEEVADTALGLLLNTVRELSAAERYLRAGRWETEGAYPLTRATLRNRTVGILGLGRIGLAVARRLEAMQVPVVYHSRHQRADVAYRYYPDLTSMAETVDTLMIVLPGTDATVNMVDAAVLKALGPDGIVINIGRGSVIDEPALIEALASRTLFAAGLDVFANEPHVPEALLRLDNAVLFPHLGSASVFTRDAMGQLMIDNLTGWFEARRPLTPVPETPVPQAG
jgi:lactate dehydrogenase-like 2-hydroxyacid dehydrogenase